MPSTQSCTLSIAAFAAEAALDLWRAGARVTLVHFGPTFDKKIKPWVLPDLENRMKEGSIAARWNSRVAAIEPGTVRIRGPRREEQLPARFVYVMTGFAPNTELLRAAGVPIVGLVENMAGYACPHCGALSDPFGQGGAEAAARELGIPFLGRVPLEIGIRRASDAGQPPALGEDTVFAPIAAQVAGWLRIN